MVGWRGMTAEEEDKMWNLHTQCRLSAKNIGKRFGMSTSKVNVFLKKRREERGVEVKVDKSRIERPL